MYINMNWNKCVKKKNIKGTTISKESKLSEFQKFGNMPVKFLFAEVF